MPSLKELRQRKKSIQSTRKITAAMKMIAAAKLKKAQENAEMARPYSHSMSLLMNNILSKHQGDLLPALVTGHLPLKNHLIIVVTSNRGLCGGFNGAVVRRAHHVIKEEKRSGKNVFLICVGRKGRDQLKNEYKDQILDTFESVDQPRYHHAHHIASKVLNLFDGRVFDSCSIIYNKFVSVLVQNVTIQPLIPFVLTQSDHTHSHHPHSHHHGGQGNKEVKNQGIYEYEPGQEEVLKALLPRNFRVQLYKALLESTAGEQGARMAAMDGATRNADDMIRKLDLYYNRTRQACITKELIEVISGAGAV
jgi:F-type H+-transporting ATPase subunit gamma